MFQVSRDSNLKIPKQIKKYDKSSNSVEDVVQIKKAVAIANNQKFNENSTRQEVSEEDKNLEIISKIPYNSNDLIVITIVKKLSAYVITVTEKSPKKFRGVFVNRMQNYCIDTLENLLQDNYIRIDSINNKIKREDLQKQAIVKLKLLGYISLVAFNSSCILKKQYKQISIHVAQAINLVIAWMKSDDKRWKEKH